MLKDLVDIFLIVVDLNSLGFSRGFSAYTLRRFKIEFVIGKESVPKEDLMERIYDCTGFNKESCHPVINGLK